jgi:hypothetical protein
MKSNPISLFLNEIFLIALILGIILFEFNAQIFEKGIGLYLRWHNHERPQLGRIWDRDREKIVAQRKIQSLLASVSVKERTSESIDSFSKLFENLNSASSQVISRDKFLQLFFDYPGQWNRKMVSPLDMIEIDSNNKWDRVLIARFGIWLTLSFIDKDNIPLKEFHVSMDTLNEIQSTRTIQKGKLEEAGFRTERIFDFLHFVGVLRTMDSTSQSALFPDPQWFLSRDYHVTRIGFADSNGIGNSEAPLIFGIEYDTGYYPNVLLIPVPLEVAHNLLSQIDPEGGDAGLNDSDSKEIEYEDEELEVINAEG